MHIDHWNLGWTNVLINISIILIFVIDFGTPMGLDLCTSCAHLRDSRQVYLKPGGNGREQQLSVKMHVTAK